MRRVIYLAVSLTCAFSLSACTLKATFETTSDGLTNFLSSTSGRSWLTEDGLVRPEHKVTAFVSYNFDNLQEDMARGGGEYVASLAHLLDLPEQEQAAFLTRSQQQFRQLSTTDRGTLATIVSDRVR